MKPSHLRLRTFSTLASALIGLALPVSSRAGTFTYNPGSWTDFTGTGAGDPTSYIADPCNPGIWPDLTLISGNSSQNYTLGATYNYTVTWTPASDSDPVPTSVTVTFSSSSCVSAFGTGVATVTQGSSQINEMDSTNDWFAGYTTSLYQESVTIPVVLQSNGTYLASGSFTTDTLSATWNSGSGGGTSCEESFTVATMVGVF